ncbi:hypothetical protein D9M70_632570 [compost metagenome]
MHRRPGNRDHAIEERAKHAASEEPGLAGVHPQAAARSITAIGEQIKRRMGNHPVGMGAIQHVRFFAPWAAKQLSEEVSHASPQARAGVRRG